MKRRYQNYIVCRAAKDQTWHTIKHASSFGKACKLVREELMKGIGADLNVILASCSDGIVIRL